LAADIALKSPPLSRVPWSWAGCYAGVNGGYAWNTGKTHYNDPNTTGDPINFIPGSIVLTTSVATPSNTGGAGGLGGGGAGCNWQSQQWVYGIEGDIDVGHIAGSQTNSLTTTASGTQIGGPPTNVTLGLGTTTTATERTEFNWLNTIRGRLGFALQDRLLLFATGGLAVGEVHSEGSVAVSNGPSSVIWSGSHSEVKAGFVVGGGAEWAFADRWTVKAEYLRYDLGNVSHALPCTNGAAGAFTCTSTPGLYPTLGSAVSAIHGSIVRFGINYKFN
jgi:outer membrane immunogenic protein